MANVADGDQLGAWLKGKPPEFPCLVAARAALRVVPILQYALQAAEEDRRRDVILPSFCALAASRFGSAWPRHRAEVRDAVRSAANRARDNIVDFANRAQRAVVEAKDAVPELYQYIWELESDDHMLGIAVRAVEAIGLAAQAVVDAADSERRIAGRGAVAESAASAVLAAQSAVDSIQGSAEPFGERDAEDDSKSEAAEHISAFWKAVELDAEYLEKGVESGKQLTDVVAGVSEKALWPNGTPVWAGRHWADFKDKLPNEEGWAVWIDWYEARVTGQAADVQFELDLAKIRADYWKRGPAYVNEIIAKLIADQVDPLHLAVSRGFEELDAVKQVTDVDLTLYKNRINDALLKDPYSAIGATKEMLEATMKTILHHRGHEEVDKLDFPKLTAQCFSVLGLTGTSRQETEGEGHLRKIASSARKMIETANKLRNRAGTGHGRVVGREPTVTRADAGLVASTGLILAVWLLRHDADA